MAIRQRGKRWLVDVSHKGQRLTATCSNRATAEVREAELRLNLVRPSVLHGPACWTLAQAWRRAYEVAWEHTPSDAAMLAMRVHLYAHWGPDTSLDAITTDLVDAWITTLRARGNSGGTINRKLAALSKVTRVAAARPERSGYTPVNRPTFTRQKEAEGRIREVTAAEEETLLGHLNHWGCHDHLDAICVLLDTGMRCGELWRMEPRDVNLKQGLISIWQTKTSHPRTVPMTKRVRAIIERRLHTWEEGPVFPYSNDWLRGVWQRVRFMMCLDNDPLFVPHILRHSCACRLVQRGVRLEVVRDWLGHKGLTMTLRYARLAPKNLLDAVSVLD